MTIKNKKYWENVLKVYYSRCKGSFELSELLSERIDYYSDRWCMDGVRFWIVRQMISEIERRWMLEHKEKK